jgi:hypothetical protein
MDTNLIAERLRGLTPAERARRNQLIEESGLAEGMARFRRERALWRAAAQGQGNTLDAKQFTRLMEAVTARGSDGRFAGPQAATTSVQPLTLTGGELAKLNADELATLSAEAWGAYGDQQAMKSPFWRN